MSWSGNNEQRGCDVRLTSPASYERGIGPYLLPVGSPLAAPPRMSSLRRFAVAGCLLLAAPALHAQQLPTADQARRAHASHPDLGAQIRREISSSGLTPDQIRARLRASGYPEDLLDRYLGTSRSPRDTLGGPPPSEDVLDAVAALGLADSTGTLAQRDSLRRVLRARRLRESLRDTTRFDRDTESDSLADAAADALAERGDVLAVDSLGRLTPARRAPLRRLTPRVVVDTGMSIFGLNVFAAA